MASRNPAAGIGCFLVTVYLATLGLGIWLVASLFQYSIWAIFRKDLPWYVDAIGGVICNGAVVAVAFFCWLLQMVGYTAPFIK